MLAQTHGHHTGRDVYVIGCGHDDGIDVLPFLIQHPALVAESLYLGEHLKGIGRTFGVDTTERDNTFAHDVLDVVETLATHTDSGNIEFLARSCVSRVAQHVPWNKLKSNC